MLALREGLPGTSERLAAFVSEFDTEIDVRLATLARELPDHQYYTMRDVIAGRGYRRVHTTTLGAGALMMWSFAGADTEPHWRHGIATGILTSLALGEDAVQRDRAFPAGLLHDLGRLALAAAPHDQEESTVSTSPALVADVAGRTVATELGLPPWLVDALGSCELGARGDKVLGAAVADACYVAAQLGYEAGGVPHPPLQQSDVRRLKHLLDEHGGGAWLDSRVSAARLAAQGHLLTVLSSA